MRLSLGKLHPHELVCLIHEILFGSMSGDRLVLL